MAVLTPTRSRAGSINKCLREWKKTKMKRKFHESMICTSPDGANWQTTYTLLELIPNCSNTATKQTAQELFFPPMHQIMLNPPSFMDVQNSVGVTSTFFFFKNVRLRVAEAENASSAHKNTYTNKWHLKCKQKILGAIKILKATDKSSREMIHAEWPELCTSLQPVFTSLTMPTNEWSQRFISAWRETQRHCSGLIFYFLLICSNRSSFIAPIRSSAPSIPIVS